jgi:8-oxo-dGTP diphosphatase
MRGDGDGWVRCERGHRHWGRYGAAGLLLRDLDTGRVMLQHRAVWSHHGGTWGLPGGARDSHESAVQTALREAGEEAGLTASVVRPTGILVDDHGGWSYTTVVAEPATPVEPGATGGESIEVRWVGTAEVDRLPLHPGFADRWPRLRSAPPGAVLVVDGANVVGARGRGDGWWRDRAGAARRLRDALAGLGTTGIAAADLPPGLPAGGLDALLPRIVLIVEGAARPVATDPPRAAVEVLSADGSGDDAIVAAAAAAAARPVLVVSADRGLAARVAAAGATTVGPSWLLSLLDGR